MAVFGIMGWVGEVALWNSHVYSRNVFTQNKLKVCSSANEIKEMQIPVVSVHQMLSSIWHAGQTQRRISLLGLGGEKGIAEFWQQSMHLAWSRDHPARKGNIAKTLGLVFHCDGVEVART